MASATSAEMGDLPSRGGPEQLLIAIDKMKEGGAKGVGDLEDEIEEYGGRNLTDNLKLGVLLSFVKREGNEVALTDTGFELAFAQDEEDEEDISDLFKDGLSGAGPYIEILRVLHESSDETYDSLIRNSDVLQLLRTEFGLTEAGEPKLKRVVSIIFETLDYAGYGERMDAGGGYPVRFSFSAEWDLASVLIDLEDAADESPPTENDGDDEQPEEPDEKESKNSDIRSNGDESPEDEGGITQGGEDDSIEMSGTHDVHTTQNVDITVNIDLDMNEMDTAEFEKKIENLKKLF